MSIGLLGKKLGMTHVYDQYGRRRSVTVVQAGPCTVLSVREPHQHQYHALQVGFEPIKESRLNKAQAGQFKKAGTGPFRYVREFRLPVTPQANGGKESSEPQWTVGQQLTVELFKEYELVDVTGISVGKGFQGGMKRWHWRGGNETHGSTSHRRVGSIGSTTTPGRVWRGHHLPGHMGADRVTVQNIRIVGLDLPNNLLLLEGAVPGSEQKLISIKKSVKRPGVIRQPRELQEIIEEDENLSKTAKAASKKLKTKT